MAEIATLSRVPRTHSPTRSSGLINHLTAARITHVATVKWKTSNGF